MSEQAEVQDLDEETAVEQLHELEQAAIDGHPVTPAEIAEARERVTLSGLVARGRAQRAEARAAEARRDAQVEAKAEAARIAAGVADLDAAASTIATALGSFLDAVDAHNGVVRTIRQVFDGAGLPTPEVWGQSDLYAVVGLDHRNHARVTDGDELRWVTVDGQTLPVLDRRSRLVEALGAAVLKLGLGRAVKIE
ncbi:hypothetical protein [Microbacterium sp. Leaf151]|uniref:hypothetical protein n=1 Tax=Microbacterium sp. Leaf151 TaxID=1736276 RepID=UPI0006F82182|nr:hypothetical protein [Microbacterium sp. Leaf151]KQR23172.1 hypothetical protein ASF76_08070 [Microbacterium sp. Leaf151]